MVALRAPLPALYAMRRTTTTTVLLLLESILPLTAASIMTVLGSW